MEVRHTRHFGRAAENLYITQAAVSARIKQLEETLGASLFIRSRNNIHLSREGERLVPHAERMLSAWVQARQDVALPTAAGQLHIGVRLGTWSSPLQKKLYAIQRSLPRVPLRVESHAPDVIIRLLLDRTLDLAILHDPPNLPELTRAAVGEVALQLYCSTPRQGVKDALAANYVYMDWGEGFARFHARQFGEQLVPALRTNMPELATDYLVDRGGASYLPSGMRKVLSKRGVYPVRDAPQFSRELSVVYRGNTEQREMIEKILGHLQKMRG
jgi:DNA-binding transcriptional LysR family regulator